MGLFDNLDSNIDVAAMNAQIAQAQQQNGGQQQFEQVPAGQYTVMLRTLELGTSRAGKPMIKCSFRILDGQYKNRILYVNRVVYGTRNDALALAGGLAWLRSLCAYDGTGYVPVEFGGFGDLMARTTYIAQCIHISGQTYTIDHKPDAYENVTITQVHYPQQQAQQ